MILKKLVLHGFKSFADKTDFDFDRGITGIVGPNGCGKSNVVDSIKWVLGSQSAKSLRGTQMLDVIFNGSGTRKPSSMAQVDLVFDNADRRLPIDQTEVTVSRRLFRSGESEYLINKQVCRLKDVKELFLDTGIGVEAYSVIEQGRVDSLLRASPVDRRAIFEEAAGISKYKVRRLEAQRRLERVNQNILRVQDIVDELEKRLRSIKVQAGKARNYQEYSTRLRELRSTFALAEYHRLFESRSTLETTVAQFSDQATGLRTAMSDHDVRLAQAANESAELEQQISALDARMLTVQSEMTGQQERVSAAEQRIVEQTDLLARCRARVAAIEQQAAVLADQIREHEAAAAEVERSVGEANAEVSALQGDERKLAAELNEVAARLEAEKAGILELVRRTSQLQNEIAALGIQQDNLVGQRSRLEARDAQIAQQLGELISRRSQLEARRAEVEALLSEQQTRLDESRNRLAVVNQSRARIAEEISGAKEQRGALQSRRQLLQELDSRREGLLAGVRDVLTRRDADTTGSAFAYVRGPVGELFEADAAHAAIVEAALGEFEQYLVVTERDALLADQQMLAALEGRVLAFSLDQTPPAINGPDLREQPGVIAPLVDWVRCPDDCQRLLRYLLGRTFVVEAIEDARRLAAQFPGSARFVTPDGVLCEPDGRVALGPLGRGSGMISRRSELRELGEQLETLAARILSLNDDLTRADDEAAQLELSQRELQQVIHNAGTQRAEAATLITSADADIAKLSAEKPQIAGEAAEIAKLMDEALRRQNASRESLGAMQQQNTDRERLIGELQIQTEQLQTRRAALTEQITQARVRAGELAQRRSAMAAAVQNLVASRDALAAEKAAAAADVASAQERIEQSQRQIVEARSALETLGQERQVVTTDASRARERRDEVRRDIDERSAAVRHLRQELDDVETELHGRDVELSQVRVRLDDLVARVRDELHIDLAERYAGYTPTEQDLAVVEGEIAELKGKIERLGNVNLDAIAEQEELEKRHDFLTSQRDDLRTSEKQLTELIEKLNLESTERFAKTFEEVRGHFSALFKKLFGGGKADVFLQNPDDVLESGIEIVVRPPGKELQSMTLLSGGEKTMTATALLLAVFRTRPSPFAILDEVDAALDEANNLRFNHVVQEFTENTQFLIITHSKRTMSIGDVLYGITMQEAGVSKRISVKFDNESAGQQQSAVA